MYSTHSAQDLYRSCSPLIDLTNSPGLPATRGLQVEETNGQKAYTTSCGGVQHQQHSSPAPYPPLPPAAPTAPQAVYLPLPVAPTLPELVANYASPAAPAQEHHHHQSPPPLPPLPPAPPLRWPSSCYNFSTPPAAAAPYPPLPRAGAVSPTTLDVECAQYCREAVDTPLPAPGALVADYRSPATGVCDGQDRRSVSPPPPPPPPPQQPPSSTGNWLPSPPPRQWWQAPPDHAGWAIPPFQPAAAPSTSTAAGSAPARNGSSDQQEQQQHQRIYSSELDGQGRRSPLPPPPPPPPPLQQHVPDSEATDGVSGHHQPKLVTSADSSSSSSGKTAVNGGGGGAAATTSRNGAFKIPKKNRSSPSSQDQHQEDRYGRQGRPKHHRDRGTSPNKQRSPYSSSSSSSSRREREDDSSHRPKSSSSGRGGGGGGGNRGVRWPQKGDGHYYPDGRDGGKHGGSGGGGGRRARDDNAIRGRYGGGGSGSRGDERDGYRRGRRDSGEDGASPGSDVSARGRNGGTGRREGEGRGGGAGGRRRGRGGKSCPPPSAEKRRDARAAAAVLPLEAEGEEEGDDELAELTSKLTALELDARGAGVGVPEEGKGKGEATGGAGKAYLSLEEYKEATAAGEMKPYKGTKYKTVDDRYADGWAYNPHTRRWIKVACQQKKDAIEALPALLARLELMESKDKLTTQRSQLLETKVEKITKEKETGRSTVSLAVPTAPVLVAFDTNWLIHNLADTMCRVKDIAGRHGDTSVLIPKEVLRELDRLKTRGKDEVTRSRAQKANRYFRGLVESTLERGREFPVVRVQEDTELFRDKGHHARPEGLGGDDSILNCCMFFTQGIDTPRKVTLITGDNNFAIRASAHGLTTTGRPQCEPGRCRMPLCPAPSRPSPFSRGY